MPLLIHYTVHFLDLALRHMFPYYISKLVRALRLVNLAGRTLPHGPLKFKVVSAAKLLRDLLPKLLELHSK